MMIQFRIEMSNIFFRHYPDYYNNNKKIILFGMMLLSFTPTSIQYLSTLAILLSLGSDSTFQRHYLKLRENIQYFKGCRRVCGAASPQSLHVELEKSQGGTGGLGWHEVDVPGPERRSLRRHPAGPWRRRLPPLSPLQ
jgi:hypothetical protein